MFINTAMSSFPLCPRVMDTEESLATVLLMCYNKPMTKTKEFYVIKISGNKYKTGCAENVEHRVKAFRVVAPSASIVDHWSCPGGVIQEHKAQRSMQNHPSCKWIGGENFEVYNEGAFVAQLRVLFGEPAQSIPTYAEKFFGVTLPRYS